MISLSEKQQGMRERFDVYSSRPFFDRLSRLIGRAKEARDQAGRFACVAILALPMKVAASSTTNRGASISPRMVQPARSSQRSRAVTLPSTVPSTMTDFVLISPRIRAFFPVVSRPLESILPSISPSIRSSFRNLTVPLMETLLDRIPPSCAVGVARFDGAGVAAGFSGSVAGLAGSFLRDENICMGLASFG